MKSINQVSIHCKMTQIEIMNINETVNFEEKKFLKQNVFELLWGGFFSSAVWKLFFRSRDHQPDVSTGESNEKDNRK